MELSEILGGAPAPAENAPVNTVEPVAEHATEPATTAGQELPPRDERGRWVKPVEPEAPAPQAQAPTEPAAHPEEKPHAVPVAALLEERRKRQELEARLAMIQQAQPPQVTDDAFWQAPAQAAQQLVGHYAQQTQQQIQNLKYELAEDLTRQMHPDYDAVRDQFVAKVHANDPWAIAIAQQMSAQSNPAKFVYDQSRRLAAIDTVGDLDSYAARIRAEERARVLKELGAQPRAVPDVPKSLNSEPSAPQPSGQPFEPTPLQSLSKFNF